MLLKLKIINYNLNIVKTFVKSKINVMGHIGLHAAIQKKNLKLKEKIKTNKKN